jgi:hypothetical protein
MEKHGRNLSSTIIEHLPTDSNLGIEVHLGVVFVAEFDGQASRMLLLPHMPGKLS